MKPKRVPRLWCALQGLLPLEACLAAQRGERAWPPEPAAPVRNEALRRVLGRPTQPVERRSFGA